MNYLSALILMFSVTLTTPAWSEKNYEHTFPDWSLEEEVTFFDAGPAIQTTTYEVDGNLVQFKFAMPCNYSGRIYPVINTEGSDWDEILGHIWIINSHGWFEFTRAKLWWKGGRYLLSKDSRTPEFTGSILGGKPFRMVVTVHGKKHVIRSNNKNIDVYDELLSKDCLGY